MITKNTDYSIQRLRGLSPKYEEGRTESAYVRLVADDGMMLKNGEQTAVCIDVLATNAENWTEVEYFEPVYESTVDNNVWNPDTYGWERKEE